MNYIKSFTPSVDTVLDGTNYLSGVSIELTDSMYTDVFINDLIEDYKRGGKSIDFTLKDGTSILISGDVGKYFECINNTEKVFNIKQFETEQVISDKIESGATSVSVDGTAAVITANNVNIESEEDISFNCTSGVFLFNTIPLEEVIVQTMGAIGRAKRAVDITARDLLTIDTVPTFVFVDDVGDGKWALYIAKKIGDASTFIASGPLSDWEKVSGSDLFNANMSRAQIEATLGGSLSEYLPISGGDIYGNLLVNTNSTDQYPITAKQSHTAPAAHYRSIGDGYLGWVGFRADNTRRFAFESDPTGDGSNFSLFLYNTTGGATKTAFSAVYGSNSLYTDMVFKGTSAEFSGTVKTEDFFEQIGSFSATRKNGIRISNGLSGDNERIWNMQGNTSSGFDWYFYNGSTWAKKATIDSSGNIFSNTKKLATEEYVSVAAKIIIPATFGVKYTYTATRDLFFELNDTGGTYYTLPYSANGWKVVGFTMACGTESSVAGSIVMRSAGGYETSLGATSFAGSAIGGSNSAPISIDCPSGGFTCRINGVSGVVSPVVVLYLQEK